MAQSIGGIRLDTRILDRITEEMRPKAAEIVNTYGLKISGEAAQNAPVDTGALRNSITSESGMTGELVYTIQDGVEYGIFVELGTSRLAARPFIYPALEHWVSSFARAFNGLFK